MRHELGLQVASRPRQRRARALAFGAWTVLRYALYMVLMLVRLPVQVIGHVLFLPLVGGGIFWGFAAGWHSQTCVWLIGTGVGLYMLGFLFDTVLLWVSPEHLYLEG